MINSMALFFKWNVLSGLLLLVYSANAQLPKADTIQTRKGEITIQPIFHGALVLNWQQTTIYIDPYGGKNAYQGQRPPDFILITHVHQDHMDTATLNAINTSKAKLIVPQSVRDQLPAPLKNKTMVLNNDKTFTASGISIAAVPMYDLPQEATSRHGKGVGNGYVLNLGGKRIYVSGDTDDIPEMRSLKNIDVAFVCMNQPFTMTVQQAASAVLDFKPKIVYPYHYRDMGGFSDVEAFKELVTTGNAAIEVRIRNWYSRPRQAARVKKTENVVYGTVSGASLTMDIYTPETSNKLGIIVIPGSAYGYAYSSAYSQVSMTTNFANDSVYFGKYARILAGRGYTLFVINHRFSPEYTYRDILGDCQRAVRYVRYHAKVYDIDPAHLGAFGYSSGATLVSMLGVTDFQNKLSQTGVDAVSSKVQSVVTLAARFDLSDFNKKEDQAIQNPIITRVLFNYVGELPMVENGNYVLSGKYAEASPITYVDKDDASFLMYGSYDDPLVPHRQETNMHKKCQENKIVAKLKMSKNEGHFPIPDMEEIDTWFLSRLKANAGNTIH